MTQEVPEEDIFLLVGMAERSQTTHILRVDSSTDEVYILHSQDCFDMRKRLGQSLTECGYSKSLANFGLASPEWSPDAYNDIPIKVRMDMLRIVPWKVLRPTHPAWKACDPE